MNIPAPSSLCTALIEKFEGCRLFAYQDGAGVWTIGWGHTGPEVINGLQWTQDQADATLQADIAKTHAEIAAVVRVDLNQNQSDALTSFTFNMGIARLEESTLLRVLNMGQYAQVPSELERWIYVAGEVSEGLKVRREAEAALWSAA